MRLDFNSLLLLFLLALTIISPNGSTREIVVITSSIEHQETSNLIEKIIANKLNIPKTLINKKIIKNPCTPITESVIHICVDQEGTIQFPYRNTAILERSFQVFRNKNL